MAAISTLIDPFVGANLTTSLWTPSTGGSATLTYGDGASCNFPSTTSSATNGNITAATNYNLTSSSIFMNVTSVPLAAAVSADAMIRLDIDASNWLRWVYEGGTLYAQRNVAASITTVTSFAFNLLTHAWWRILELSGTIYWDTSTDGVTWTNRGTYAHSLTITAITPLIAGLTSGVETSPGKFTWKFLNVTNVDGPFNHLRVGNGMSRSEVAN